MEFANWEGHEHVHEKSSIPLPTDDFDQYFNGDIDNLFNDTLAGLEDLDVPSGFANQQLNNNNENNSNDNDNNNSNNVNNNNSRHPSSSPSPQNHYRKHSRKISGTAIFGFASHDKQLSIGGSSNTNSSGTPIISGVPTTNDLIYKKPDDFGNSVSPGQLLKTSYSSPHKSPIHFMLPQHPLEDEEEEISGGGGEELNVNGEAKLKLGQPVRIKPETDFITNESPKDYKFPPSPIEPKQPIINNFSAKYLQEFNQNGKVVEYADDIEPLLNEQVVSSSQFEGMAQSSPFNNNKIINSTIIHNNNQQPHPPQQQQQQQQPNSTGGYKFVPIPVQIPRGVESLNNTKNVFLPPPSPPTLSNGSPDWSSPEPQSPSPSPSRYSTQRQPQPYNNNPNFSSPVHPQQGKNFYTPQFFSDSNPIGFIEPNRNTLAYQEQSPSSTQQQIHQIQQQQQLLQQQRIQQQQQQRLQQQHQQHLQYQQQHQQQIHQQHIQQQQQQQQITHLNSSPQRSHPNLNNNIPSSPNTNSLNSSPVRYYSPLRNVAGNNNSGDESLIDINATIVQLTPLKETNFQSTPTKLDLKWSPVISPNAKSSRDVRKAIQQFTPKRKIEKTSLLPPGELDQYWEGPDENKVFTCVYNGCGKKFTRRYNVRSHIQTHLSDRPFACAYCPKKFVRQHDLNRHVKRHQEALYCKCPCGKEFARLDAMRKHRARNICVGGDASNENHCIVKPKRKSSVILMDEFTTELLSEEITQMTR